ncbi:MAG: NAD-dependent epimerase/dehydratase family protein [Candidatus Fermentibacteraceae bacterium]
MTSIVTGAAGFIGSRLCAGLLSRGENVLGVDCLRDYYDVALKHRNLRDLSDHPGFSFSPHDLSLGTAFIQGILPPEEPVVVYHLAAQAGVRKSWGSDFSQYTQDNITATQNLLEWAVHRGFVEHFVFASSSSVYGIPSEMPMREDVTIPVPHSPYGVTKLAAENLVRLYGSNHGLVWTALRLFSVYGPGQRPDMAFNRFIRSALAGTPITLFGTGNQTRDFTYVDDVTRALILAGRSSGGIVMNLGGGIRVSVNRVIGILEDILDTRISVNRMPVPPGDVPDTWADTEKAGRILGWHPEHTLEEGLAREAEWLRPV